LSNFQESFRPEKLGTKNVLTTARLKIADAKQIKQIKQIKQGARPQWVKPGGRA
jgi:hypothetical protein